MQRSAKRARTALALAVAVLLAPVLWVVVAGAVGSDAGDVDIVPDLGNSETAFTLDLPDGAACTGDSANGGYTVTSFMVRGDVDLTTLTFDPLAGPIPIATGESFRHPLYEVGSGTPFAAVQTANADAPGGPGVIIGVPQFDLVSAGFTAGQIPAGVYKVGIACQKGPPGPNQLDRFWNTTMTISTDPQGGAAQVSWVEGTVSTTTTTSGGGTTTSTTTGDTTTSTTSGGGTTTSTTTGSTTTSSSSSTTSTTQPPGTTTSTTTASTTSTTQPPGTTTSTTTASTTSTTAPTTTTTAPATTTTTTAPATTTTTAPATTTSTTAASTTSTTRPATTTSSSSSSTSTTSTTLPAGCTVTTSVAAGGAVTVSCTGWQAGSTVGVVLTSDPVTLPSLTADSTGKLAGTITIPTNTAPGAHTLTLSGKDSSGANRTLTAGITVTAAGSTTSAVGSVPRTGSDVGPQLLVALLLVGAGGVLVEVARRRRLTP